MEAYAAARLASMTLPEKVASLFMIHVPGTDAGAIRAVSRLDRRQRHHRHGRQRAGLGRRARGRQRAVERRPRAPVAHRDRPGGRDRAPAPGRRLPRGAATEGCRARGRSVGVRRAGGARRLRRCLDQLRHRRRRDRGSAVVHLLPGARNGCRFRGPARRRGRRGGAGHGAVDPQALPGHGSVGATRTPASRSTAMSLDEWRATQAPPFEAGIDAGAELVMFGHLRYTAVDSAPATLSAAWHAAAARGAGIRRDHRDRRPVDAPAQRRSRLRRPGGQRGRGGRRRQHPVALRRTRRRRCGPRRDRRGGRGRSDRRGHRSTTPRCACCSLAAPSRVRPARTSAAPPPVRRSSARYRARLSSRGSGRSGGRHSRCPSAPWR